MPKTPCKGGSLDHASRAGRVPASDGIWFDEHWLKLKRTAGCNMDTGQIANQFRAFCRSKGIGLDARNIEKVFSDYCGKVRHA